VENTLQAVLDVAGVSAAIVFDGAGRIVCHRGRSICDRSLCERLGRPLAKAIDTVQLEQVDWETISGRFADGWVLVRNLGDSETAYALAVVADPTLSLSFATIAIRVAANKLRKVLGDGASSSTVGWSTVGSSTVGSSTVGSSTVGSSSVGSPSVDSPSVDSPSVDSPSVGSPSVGSPSVGSSSVGSPSVDSPSVGSASVDSPSVGGTRLFSMPLSQAVRRIHKNGPTTSAPPSPPPQAASTPRPPTPAPPPTCAPSELEKLQEIARSELGQYAPQALEILSLAGPSQSSLLRAASEIEKMIRLFVNRKDAKKVGHRMRAALGEQTR
jgi:hypothetical protein